MATLSEAMDDAARHAAEQKFADTLRVTLEAFNQIQVDAHAVRDTGGNCAEVFTSLFDEPEARQQAAMQWPMIAMMLGV